MNNTHYAVILAGGSGERFWPLSRRSKPKQLLSLITERTFLEETVARLEGVVERDNILVLTNADQEDAVRQVLGAMLPNENIYAEPAKRDTAPAVALAVALVQQRNPDACMAILPADHHIPDVAAFQEDLRRAYQAAESDPQALVTVGIPPTWACPSFGYIETLNDQADFQGVLPVKRFREKPSAELAEHFLAKGGFFWNAGMFFWQATALVKELENLRPALADFVHKTQTLPIGDPAWKEGFAELDKISIDYAVMENAKRVLCVPAKFPWDDLGHWNALAGYLKETQGQVKTNTPVVSLESEGAIVYSTSGKTVALIGAEDFIVVDTEDAVLVAHREQADRIKKVVAMLPPELQ
ncbi:MAG: mannose-1-phosphate guanylyltransferase [Verrucomicrobiales bacterium]